VKLFLDLLVLAVMGYFRFRNWRRMRHLERELARTQRFLNMPVLEGE
jgi:hypothetical protein